jgi:membrane protein implicated in regulation of membrane protease activity
MTEWWETLTSFEKLFWYIAVPFSVILFIQLILTFAGMGGSDADVGGGDTDISGLDLDEDIDLDMDAGGTDGADSDMSDVTPAFHFFTIRNFIAFFTMFGWAGIAAIKNGFSVSGTIAIAFGAGLVAMLIVSALFYFLSKMQDSGGTLNIRNALGKTGEVYIPVLGESKNIGKIRITVQGTLREMQAITKGEDDLPTGTVVKVTGVMNDNILKVEKVTK